MFPKVYYIKNFAGYNYRHNLTKQSRINYPRAEQQPTKQVCLFVADNEIEVQESESCFRGVLYIRFSVVDFRNVAP